MRQPTKSEINSFIGYMSGRRQVDTSDLVRSEFALISISKLIDRARSKGYYISAKEMSHVKSRHNYQFKYYGMMAGDPRYGALMFDEIVKDGDTVHILIDANNIIYRMYFATKGSVEKTVNHFHGIMKKIKDVLSVDDTQWDKFFLTVMHDNRHCFRRKLYKEYKKGRHKGQDIDWRAFTKAQELIKKNKRYRQIEVKNFECDDLIGAYLYKIREKRKKEKKKNRDLFVIVSNDKDFYQLLYHGRKYEVVIVRPGKEWSFVTANSFYQDYSIKKPSDFLDVKAVMGDMGDNIPGINGIGIKKATRLITLLGPLDEWCLNKNLSKIQKKHIIDNVKQNKLFKEAKACFHERKLLSRNLILMDLNNPKIIKRINFKKNLLKGN